MPEHFIWIMVGGMVAHWVFVPIVVVLAKAQGRDAFFWGIVGVILGPLALVVFYFWRGDRGAKGRTSPPLADPEEDPMHQHSSRSEPGHEPRRSG